MKKHILLIIFILIVSCKKKDTNNFTINSKSLHTTIYIDNDSPELIKWAVNDLSKDIEKILGKKITIEHTNIFHPENKGIYIGEFNNKLIESLPENYNNRLENEWEKFIIKKHQENLFIVGSDIRGTVYGIFDVAKRIGISPWKWWADVHPEKKEAIVLNLPPTGIESAPSVQYRGIFLNDEIWALRPWASDTFDPENGVIGPKTYEKIFQLLLRLKANTIWPAMHYGTKAFYNISGNNKMAKKYKIVIGTSHIEPMMRNNIGEWDNNKFGAYNYFSNSNVIRKYWTERIQQVKDAENIITLGMRGVGDSQMEGGKNEKEKVKLLEQIILDQREILIKNRDTPIEEIPQVLTVYKEVLNLYNKGLKVPDDVTLMWCDDNFGYIRRLSNEKEQQRKGGSGVYYHLSYWGSPHDYLWLSSTQPGLIWYEMSRAYQNGAKKIWIANVGDIKPGEYNMEFFLDLAWDVNSINESTIKKHLVDWCIREFGKEKAEDIAHVLDEYYRLAFLRKPEHMGWSTSGWPITETRPTEFNLQGAQRRIESYTQLTEKVNAIKPFIAQNRMDAFFQLVEYPVKGAALMNHKFLFAQQSFLSNTKREKENLAHKSQMAFDKIITLTQHYNNNISNGKWQNMMSMQPRNLPVYKMPNYHLKDTLHIEKAHFKEIKQTTPIILEAKAYSKVQDVGDYQWKFIDGLGYSNSSITLFPFENHIFQDKKPSISYTFTIEKAGKYQLEVRCLPTHSNNSDQKIWISLNDKDIQSYVMNAKVKSSQWSENVLRNFVSVKSSLTFEKPGQHTLKLSINQPGIVIDQIAIYPENHQKYYEIPN